MADLTTAQRLAAYKQELIAEGFTEVEAAQLVENAAPSLIEDVEVAADLDPDVTTIGEVRVQLMPRVDEDDLQRLAAHVQSTVQRAVQR